MAWRSGVESRGEMVARMQVQFTAMEKEAAHKDTVLERLLAHAKSTKQVRQVHQAGPPPFLPSSPHLSRFLFFISAFAQTGRQDGLGWGGVGRGGVGLAVVAWVGKRIAAEGRGRALRLRAQAGRQGAQGGMVVLLAWEGFCFTARCQRAGEQAMVAARDRTLRIEEQLESMGDQLAKERAKTRRERENTVHVTVVETISGCKGSRAFCISNACHAATAPDSPLAISQRILFLPSACILINHSLPVPAPTAAAALVVAEVHMAAEEMAGRVGRLESEVQRKEREMQHSRQEADAVRAQLHATQQVGRVTGCGGANEGLNWCVSGKGLSGEGLSGDGLSGEGLNEGVKLLIPARQAREEQAARQQADAAVEEERAAVAAAVARQMSAEQRLMEAQARVELLMEAQACVQRLMEAQARVQLLEGAVDSLKPSHQPSLFHPPPHPISRPRAPVWCGAWEQEVAASKDSLLAAVKEETMRNADMQLAAANTRKVRPAGAPYLVRAFFTPTLTCCTATPPRTHAPSAPSW
ncbi:unnamed protein product [Closterium sp. NIES-64]|nr:unnamed protein product [Closterium sp. NIES-64]